jgi:hypothetical protein
MGSIWFKNKQSNQAAPRKSFTSPNLFKYIFASKEWSPNSRNIPGSVSDTKISTIIIKNVINNNQMQNEATKQETSSISSEEKGRKENELPKPNFSFPLLDHIYPNRNRRATVAQIDGSF